MTEAMPTIVQRLATAASNNRIQAERGTDTTGHALDHAQKAGKRATAEMHDQAKSEITRLQSELNTALERVADLEKLVYVPGLWRCPKCAFQLVQANLNASDGSVTARDQPGDKCPNCDSPLWRVTEREAGNKVIDDSEKHFLRLKSERDTALERVKVLEEDQKALLEWALYQEPGGVGLVNRMTAYAMKNREQAKGRAVIQSEGK